jgi:DNA segregation ATPase FtsK/SpoIIIE, S-DNA-T family
VRIRIPIGPGASPLPGGNENRHDQTYPRCTRIGTVTSLLMVLGEQAFERGAWDNRIGESEAGVGYVVGEGTREPVRIRAGWVPDETIKQLEAFVTDPITHDTALLPFPTKPTDPTGSTWGGAA